MQRHKSLFHRHPPNQQRPGKHICRFKIANAESSAERECGLQIPSAYRLAQHRKQAMHTKRGQTSEPDSVPPKRPREGEGSRENRGRQLDEEVERCAICALTDEDEVDGDRGWIECDICGCWYHLHCLPEGHETPDLEDEDITFSGLAISATKDISTYMLVPPVLPWRRRTYVQHVSGLSFSIFWASNAYIPSVFLDLT